MKIIQIVLVFVSMFMFISCNSDSQTKSEKSNKQVSTKKQSTQNPPKSKTQTKRKEEPEVKIENASLSTTITLGNIDYNLINARLFQKINKERKRLGLRLFKNNNDLKKAAKIHNDYMVRADILDHNESGTSTPELRDRVEKAGGKFRTAGENIQYEGFIIRTTNGVESIVAPTYEALAEQLWQNWKTSPPHYKNLTNPEFIYLGTSLKWSSKKTAVFATQVYGG